VLKALTLYVLPPNSTTVSWRIVEINTGNIRCSYFKFACGYNTAYSRVLANNAAVAVVTSIQLGINRIYIETDY
jgi:hypothetical protein